ncbi:MAG: TonB-dependent receptor [Hyphomonadaceae bacterium]
MARKSNRRSAALSSAALALALAFGAANFATPAFAQDQDEIIVTGSRILVDPLSQTQPITTVGAEEIARTGLSATADVLQRLPLAGGGLNTRNNSSGNFGNPADGGGVGAGAAEINLRYLGSPRTLVLVDGLRWVNASSASGVPGAVDLNTIPEAMIDRIEVLQQGASPIYGSDAIAGVVNIITRREQDGIIASAQYGGFLEEGDGETTNVNLSWGRNFGSTDIVLGGGYVNQEPVMAADRPTANFPTPGVNGCDATCSSGTPNGRFILLGDDLTLINALAPGQIPTPGDYRDFVSPGDRFNFQPFNYVVTPSERFSAFGQLTHEFSPALAFRLRASYVNRQSANQAAPLPLFVGPDAGNGNLLDTVVIDASNPYNPYGVTLGPGTLTFIGRRLVEAGPRHYEQEVDTTNVTASLFGDIGLLGRDWRWDMNVVHSVNHAEQTFTGNVNAQRVVQALGPVADCTGACVPLNIFGGAGTITPDMLGYIGFIQRDESEQQLDDYSANITGDLWELPAGPLGMAAGVEYRRTEGYFQPDPIVAAGFSSDIPAQPASGKIDVTEAYVEFRAPLLAGQPLFEELTATLAARVFDYSTSGADETYQVGLNWRPTEEMLVRLSWGEGFRAPTIGELFGTASRFDQEVRDPCSDMLGLSGGPVASGTVQANCIAEGVPADGSYVQLNAQVPVITSGNQALQPETSEGYNIGFVWQPSFLEATTVSDGVTVEVNYSDITLDGAIKAQDGQSLLDRCAQINDTLACNTITRTGTGTISGIANPLINIGGIETRGVDVTVDWRFPETSIGTFGLRSSTAFLIEYNELLPASGGLVSIPREGTERGNPDQAYPEIKSTLTLNWDYLEWGASLTARYISEVDEPVGVNNTLSSITYLDAQARWTPAMFDDRVTIALGVNNLADEDPPGCFSCGLNNFDPTTYDPPGRFGYLRIAYRQ